MGELEKTTLTGRKATIRMPGGREQNSCLNPKNVSREILMGGKCQRDLQAGRLQRAGRAHWPQGPDGWSEGTAAQMGPPWGRGPG